MADVQVNQLTTATAPTSTDSVVMVNRDTNEGKIIDASFFLKPVVIVPVPNGITSLPRNLTGLTDVTADMVLIRSEMGNDEVMTSDWNVTIGNGEISITGSMEADSSTTLTLYLARQKA